MQRDELVLLDPTTDAEAGTLDKVEVHRRGLYHSAVSVLLFDSDDRQLLQRRAAAKYHSPGLWSNACCTHPFPGESPRRAASRRLFEELGINCHLRHFGTIRYRAPVLLAPTNGDSKSWVEYERVELFAGVYDGAYNYNPVEVEAVAAVPLHRLEPLSRGGYFTPWFTVYMGLRDNKMIKQALGYCGLRDGPKDYGFHDCLAEHPTVSVR